MGQLDYDSTQRTEVPMGAEGYAALVGQSFTVKLSPQGRVLKIEDLEKVREAVEKKLPPGMEASSMDGLKVFLDEASLKDMTELSMAMYPDAAVAPGDSWSRKMPVTMGFGIIVDSKWTLQKQEGGVATIQQAASIASNPDAPPMEIAGTAVKFDLAGTQEGTIRMDEATGLATLSEIHQRIKGDMKAGVAADGSSVMTMPIAFETDMTAEISDRMWKTEAP